MARKIVERDRREPRYRVAAEVHVRDGAQQFVSLTREVSRSGLFFFTAVAPAKGRQVSLILHTEEGPIALEATVRYALREVGVGVELGGAAGELARYHAFVESVAAHSAWSAIGEFVRPAAEESASGRDRLASRGGSALASRDPMFGAGVREHRELVALGERCRALSILFARCPAVPVREVLADAGARAAELVEGVSREPIGLRLHARDRLRRVHVAVLRGGRGFAALIAPAQEAAAEYHLYSLSGREEMAISAGGQPIFPHFSEAELQELRRDAVKDVPPSYAVAPPARVRGTKTDSLPEFPVAAAFRDWTRMSEPALDALETLLRQLDAETRVYQIGSRQHEVRLLRSVPVLLRAEPSAEPRSVALMHDGRRMCALFGLDTGALEIRPLAASDELLIRLEAAA